MDQGWPWPHRPKYTLSCAFRVLPAPLPPSVAALTMGLWLGSKDPNKSCLFPYGGPLEVFKASFKNAQMKISFHCNGSCYSPGLGQSPRSSWSHDLEIHPPSVPISSQASIVGAGTPSVCFDHTQATAVPLTSVALSSLLWA